MKKIVSVQEVNGEGLEGLLGERVLLMCANYFYHGKLVGINTDCVLLEDAAIVYETGEWSAKQFQDRQPIGVDKFYVNKAFIESYGAMK